MVLKLGCHACDVDVNPGHYLVAFSSKKSISMSFLRPQQDAEVDSSADNKWPNIPVHCQTR